MNTQLFQRFFFQKKIEIKNLPEGGDEVIALPEKTIIKADEASLKQNLAEILAHAKLGEIDPLLATFFFQENMTQEEERCAWMFFRLCQPLQDAWVYKIMRKYVPDIYEKEINELLEMWDKLAIQMTKDTDSETRRQVLSMFTILSENPINKIELIIKTDEEHRLDWNNYITALKELIHKDPDPKLFLKLPETVNAPYQVQIITLPDKFKYFEIKPTRRLYV